MWRPGQNAFFDIRLINVNENSQEHQTVENILKKHEKEKRRAYNNRIMNVEHGTFIALDFSLTEGEVPETSTFHKHIAQKYCEKNEGKYEKILSLITCKLSFLILRSVLICVKGSCSVSNDNVVLYGVSLTGQKLVCFEYLCDDPNFFQIAIANLQLVHAFSPHF